MTTPQALAVLDELAAAVMAADPSDASSIEQVAKLLAQLRTHPLAQDAAGLIDRCSAQLEALSEAEGDEAQSALDQICSNVSEIQRCLEAAQAAEKAAGASSPLVDPALMREFADGARTSLDEAETEILAAEQGDEEALGMLCRRIHTLKGESGVLGLSASATVCHAVEEVLQRTPGADWADRLLRACDWLRSAAIDAAEGRPEPSATTILHYLAKQAPPPAPAAEAALAIPAAEIRIAAPSTPAVEATCQQPRVERDEETIALFAEFLHESEDGLGRVDQVLMNVEREGADPEAVNLLFRIFHTIKGVAGALEVQQVTSLAHATESMLNRVREGKLELRGPVVDLVFDSTEMAASMMRKVRRGIETGTEFELTEGLQGLLDRLEAARQGAPVAESQPDPLPGMRLGEILSMPPLDVPSAVIDEALKAQKVTGRRLGEELIAQGAVKPKQVAQALRAQNAVVDPSTGAQGHRLQETIKVDLARVDSLVEMIGELVIVETMVAHAPEVVSLTSPRVQNYLSQLSKITRDLQDVGMRMRMVPVRGVFQKMARMARDLGKKADKQVQLITSGEGTEMDRSMVEQVGDPLVHMIRNSLDHGLEPAEDRLRVGKPAMGTVRLSAFHEGGSIVIEVADDGRGLDRETIARKALSKGLISDPDKLTDAEVYNLIFAPGFSTAAQVTEISGRGVGMDVVKRNVEKMRGRVLISTKRGEGTTFKIVLPLTLAIIDGMLVRCGEERYILPTLSIIESIQPDASMLVSFASKGELVNVRGEILPLMRLDRLFVVAGAQQDPTRGLVVIVESLGKKLGLLVDEVITQQQVVIKSLGTGLANIRFVSGAAILSDGRVGLILNMAEIGGLAGLDEVGRPKERATREQFSQVCAP
ncbi:MAG: chemotaxis protein CheW [Deltaproteobacteria bacterium]|nr:chemotaxis protein CheW [Deltaproteobacteria bacterium]